MEKQLHTLLSKAGLKVTPGRLAILAALSRSPCQPLDAKAINKLVKGQGLDLATIYRTLATFEKKFLVKRVNTTLNGVSYELSSHHHDHLICIECGVLEPFNNCDLEQLTKTVLKKSAHFNKIYDHSLELIGVCDGCLKKR